MSLTNFSLLTDEQKTIWSMDLWKQARNYSFVDKFLGKDPNSLIQHITELKKSEKGARAVITLLADLEGDGIAGDRTLEGNEEAMKSYDQAIRLDQLRHANRHEGRMADQKSVVEFRNNSRDVLAYWLADRIDQIAFLTLGGLAYSVKNAGGVRVGSDLPSLEFAADVTAPSSLRSARWNGTTDVLNFSEGSSDVAAADTPSWELFVQLKAYAKDNYIRGVKEPGGEENYHAFLSPTAMAKLKLDETYMLNVRNAQTRSDKTRCLRAPLSRLTASTSTSSGTYRTRASPRAGRSTVPAERWTGARSCSVALRLWAWQTLAPLSGSRRALTTITSRVSRSARSSASSSPSSTPSIPAARYRITA
jgi:N4-gp56 family major capsid protein